MRKTVNDKALIKAKLEEILEKIEKYEISYYEAHKHIDDVSISGLRRIFQRESKNPSLANVLAIENFIKTNYENEEINNLPLENSSNFEAKILKRLNDIETKIDAQSLKQEIMFEILKIAKASELEAFEKNMHRLKPSLVPKRG